MTEDLARRVADYLAVLTAERGLSANTIDAYRRDLTDYMDRLGDEEPTPERVEAYVGELRRRGLSPRTVARKVAAIRGFHRHAVIEDESDTDPTAQLDSPKRPQSLPKALTVAETLRLLDSVDVDTVPGARDAALLEFMYATGSRVSETVGIDLAHIDLIDRVAIVTGKGRKQRMVPLGRAAVIALERWLPLRLELSDGRTDAVFLNLRGGRLTRQGVFRIVRQAADRAGLDRARISPHVLRHSAATHMIEGGADLRTVQELLGHANVSTTQIYTRVSPQHLIEVFTLAHPRSR